MISLFSARYFVVLLSFWLFFSPIFPSYYARSHVAPMTEASNVSLASSSSSSALSTERNQVEGTPPDLQAPSIDKKSSLHKDFKVFQQSNRDTFLGRVSTALKLLYSPFFRLTSLTIVLAVLSLYVTFYLIPWNFSGKPYVTYGFVVISVLSSLLAIWVRLKTPSNFRPAFSASSLPSFKENSSFMSSGNSKSLERYRPSGLWTALRPFQQTLVLIFGCYWPFLMYYSFPFLNIYEQVKINNSKDHIEAVNSISIAKPDIVNFISSQKVSHLVEPFPHPVTQIEATLQDDSSVFRETTKGCSPLKPDEPFEDLLRAHYAFILAHESVNDKYLDWTLTAVKTHCDQLDALFSQATEIESSFSIKSLALKSQSTDALNFTLFSAVIEGQLAFHRDLSSSLTLLKTKPLMDRRQNGDLMEVCLTLFSHYKVLPCACIKDIKELQDLVHQHIEATIDAVSKENESPEILWSLRELIVSQLDQLPSLKELEILPVDEPILKDIIPLVEKAYASSTASVTHQVPGTRLSAEATSMVPNPMQTSETESSTVEPSHVQQVMHPSPVSPLFPSSPETLDIQRPTPEAPATTLPQSIHSRMLPSQGILPVAAESQKVALEVEEPPSPASDDARMSHSDSSFASFSSSESVLDMGVDVTPITFLTASLEEAVNGQNQESTNDEKGLKTSETLLDSNEGTDDFQESDNRQAAKSDASTEIQTSELDPLDQSVEAAKEGTRSLEELDHIQEVQTPTEIMHNSASTSSSEFYQTADCTSNSEQPIIATELPIIATELPAEVSPMEQTKLVPIKRQQEQADRPVPMRKQAVLSKEQKHQRFAAFKAQKSLENRKKGLARQAQVHEERRKNKEIKANERTKAKAEALRQRQIAIEEQAKLREEQERLERLKKEKKEEEAARLQDERRKKEAAEQAEIKRQVEEDEARRQKADAEEHQRKIHQERKAKLQKIEEEKARRTKQKASQQGNTGPNPKIKSIIKARLKADKQKKAAGFFGSLF